MLLCRKLLVYNKHIKAFKLMWFGQLARLAKFDEVETLHNALTLHSPSLHHPPSPQPSSPSRQHTGHPVKLDANSEFGGGSHNHRLIVTHISCSPSYMGQHVTTFIRVLHFAFVLKDHFWTPSRGSGKNKNKLSNKK